MTIFNENYIEQAVRNNQMAKGHQELNLKLLKNYGAFVHPYLTGGVVMHFEQLEKKGELTESVVFKAFAELFLNFNHTVSYIEGFVKVCPSLNPFFHLIDQSIVLCIQRDYAGAINTLIPVIEGAMRKYLNDNKVENPEKKHFVPLFFEHINVRYSNTVSHYYEKESQYYNQNLAPEKISELTNLNREFSEAWVSIIIDFLKNNLYKDTREQGANDLLNRHSIFHGFKSEKYYGFENYLKVLHSIYFLAYTLGLAGENKVLSEIKNEDVVYKWKAWEKLRIISNASIEVKKTIYGNYTPFDWEIFEIEKTTLKQRLIKPSDNLGTQLKKVDMFFEMLARAEKINRNKKDGNKLQPIKQKPNRFVLRLLKLWGQ